MNRTELRHRTLSLVAAGLVQMYQHPGSVWDGFIHGGTRLTESGQRLLSEWNERYGEVQL